MPHYSATPFENCLERAFSVRDRVGVGLIQIVVATIHPGESVGAMRRLKYVCCVNRYRVHEAPCGFHSDLSIANRLRWPLLLAVLLSIGLWFGAIKFFLKVAAAVNL
jgi:hypothetical protein